jgi:hypothetical protein
MSDLYEDDILLWSERQADLLRRRAAGELVNDAALDWLNVADEIEDVGRSEFRSCRSLLRQALRHMLKAEVWPLYRDAPAWLLMQSTSADRLETPLPPPCGRRLTLPRYMPTRSPHCPRRWTVNRHCRSPRPAA